MSFSADVKKELSLVQPEKECCGLTELSALFSAAGSLSLLGRGKVNVQFSNESLAVCRRIYTLLVQELRVTPQIHYVTSPRFGGRRRCVLTLGPMQTPAFLTAMKMADELPEGGIRLKSAYPKLSLTRLCCMKAYLRGIMLGCGTMNPPEAGYHLELPCKDGEAQANMAKCMQRLGLPVHFSSRRGRGYMYLKQSEEIVTLLTALGAAGSVMRIEDFRVKTQVYNALKRTANCDSFNLRKQANTGAEQAEVIRRLRDAGKLEGLAPALREIAYARLEAPDASLAELGEMCVPPVGKSGVNHRLRRLMELGKED